jgi:hypothetical protein
MLNALYFHCAATRNRLHVDRRACMRARLASQVIKTARGLLIIFYAHVGAGSAERATQPMT